MLFLFYGTLKVLIRMGYYGIYGMLINHGYVISIHQAWYLQYRMGPRVRSRAQLPVAEQKSG